jgi:hypothetical protein
MSVILYLIIGLYTGPVSPFTINNDEFVILKIVLYVTGFLMLIAARYVRTFILHGIGRKRQPSQTSMEQALVKYFIAMILTMAILDAIGIYGLILVFLGKNQIDLYLLVLVSAAAISLYRPKRRELLSMVHGNQQDSTPVETKP